MGCTSLIGAEIFLPADLVGRDLNQEWYGERKFPTALWRCGGQVKQGKVWGDMNERQHIIKKWGLSRVTTRMCIWARKQLQGILWEPTQTFFQKSGCCRACLKSSYAEGYSVASHSAWWTNMRNRDLCALAGQLPCWDNSDVLGQQTWLNGSNAGT